MPEIDVKKSFTLTHDHIQTKFKVGKQTVSQEIADHWYVQAHLVGAKPRPAPGTPAFLRAENEARAAAEKAREDEDSALDAEIAAEERAKAQAKIDEQAEVALREQADAKTAAARKSGK